MGEVHHDAATRRSRARVLVLALAALQAAFWGYAFYYIGERTNPWGDVLEWLPVGPVTVIFLGLVVPALTMGIMNRALRTATILLVAALAANAVVWSQIVAEFAR
jgi:formate-dependent nitrite reductase membrane component NrfD